MVAALDCRHLPGLAALWRFLLAAVCVFGRSPVAMGTTPTLVRLTDGSANPPTNDGRIFFQGVGYADGQRTFYAAQNPLIQGRNLYAIDMVRTAAGWNAYYGGWQTTGQVDDLIYMSTINGLDPSGPWSTPRPIIANGAYHHVNDPTVVIDGGMHHMLYTAARWHTDPQLGSHFRDWINYSSSIHGLDWSPSSGTAATEVALTDPRGLAPGALTSIARPSLVKTDSGWKLWFDGNAQNQPGAGIHSYLAHSIGDSPTSFEIVHRYPDIGGFPGFFEPDVVLRSDGTYFAVVQRHFGRLYFATSDNGVEFTFHGPVLDVADQFYPREMVSNPGLIYDQMNDTNYGVAFGMASSHLTDHDIGFAYTQYTVFVRSPATSPGGQPVWHTFARSGRIDEQLVSVFNFDEFDLVRVIDPITGAVVLEQDFTAAHPGDVWKLFFGIPGDYNSDGSVDSADYVVWRTNQGTSNSLPNDPLGGTIDSRQYVQWRANFGQTNGGSGSSANSAVPEPATVAMLLNLALMILAYRSAL